MSDTMTSFLKDVVSLETFKENSLISEMHDKVQTHMNSYWNGEFDTTLKTVFVNLQNALELDQEGRYDQMVQSLKVDDAKDVLDAVYFLIKAVDYNLAKLI